MKDKIITIWEQEFVIPGGLSQAEEDEMIESLMKPAAEAYLQRCAIKRAKKAKETRGRKPKPVILSAEEKEENRLREARLSAPMHLTFVSKELLQEWAEDGWDEESDKEESNK